MIECKAIHLLIKELDGGRFLMEHFTNLIIEGHMVKFHKIKVNSNLIILQTSNPLSRVQNDIIVLNIFTFIEQYYFVLLKMDKLSEINQNWKKNLLNESSERSSYLDIVFTKLSTFSIEGRDKIELLSPSWNISLIESIWSFKERDK